MSSHHSLQAEEGTQILGPNSSKIFPPFSEISSAFGQYTGGYTMLSTSEVKTVGLCITCNNSATCEYRKKRGMDAIFCEMYDGYSPPNGNGHHDEDTVLLEVEDTAQPKLKGLCINCDNRHTCKHVKPDGGVWHCEDYC